MSELKEELKARLFDILTPEFFISAMQSGQGPASGETLGSWVVRVHKDASEAINANHSQDALVEQESDSERIGQRLREYLKNLNYKARHID